MVNPADDRRQAIERARVARRPYEDALRASGRSRLRLLWLYMIGWPALLSFAYGGIALAQGDVRDGAPALVMAVGWSLVVAVVVLAIMSPMQRRARQVQALAAKLGGLAFRGPRPDRVLAWLERHWAGDTPASLIHDPSGTRYYVGLEARVGHDDLLIVGVRPSFLPRVRLALFFAAPAPAFPLDAETEAWLGEQGYAVSRSDHGVLLRREPAPRSAFAPEHLEGVVRALWRSAHTPAIAADARATRARLRNVTMQRWRRVLSFSERDLRLNAHGLLSAMQRARCAVHGLIALAFSVLSGGWGVHTLLSNPASGRGHSSPFSLSLGLLVYALFAFGAGWYALEALWDVLDGHAAVVVGTVEYRRHVGSKGGVTHHLACGSHEFLVSASCEFALEAHVPYRVYFTRHTSLLLSLERADA